MKAWLYRVSALLLGAALVVLLGCEGSDDTQSLTVHPSRVSLGSSDYYQVFIASGPTLTATNTTRALTPEPQSEDEGPTGSEPTETYTGSGGGLRALALPLEWSVSDPNLGSIREATGDRAVYVRTSALGMNVITVKDQYGAEGVATVNQK
jgi:hypothetical protein